jgi:hypothetical protein
MNHIIIYPILYPLYFTTVPLCPILHLSPIVSLLRVESPPTVLLFPIVPLPSIL